MQLVASAPTDEINRAVVHHGQQPRTHATPLRPIAAAASPPSEECFLNSILRATVLTAYSPRHAIGAIGVAVIVLAERLGAPGSHPGYELAVGDRRGRRHGLHRTHAHPWADRGRGAASRKNSSHATPGVVWFALRKATTRRRVRRSIVAVNSSSESV